MLPIVTSALGTARFYAGDVPGAITEYQRALELDPDFARARLALGVVLTEEERHAEAITEIAAVRQEVGETSEVLGALAHAYGRAGRRGEARQLLVALARRERQETVPALVWALAEAGAGDRARAREALAKACRERTVSAAAARFDPRLAAVRWKEGCPSSPKRETVP